MFIHSRLDDYGLSVPEFRVYCHLARRAGRGTAFPSVRTMAQVCRLHPQTVRNVLKALIRYGLLVCQERSGRTSLYRLTAPSQWQSPVYPAHTESEAAAPLPGSGDTPADAVQSPPVGSDGVEGNPPEGQTKKAEYTQDEEDIPHNEDEAVRWAALAGVPAEFAGTVFNRVAAVGWLDGCKRRIVSWTHYVKSRWESRRIGLSSDSRSGSPTRSALNAWQTPYALAQQKAALQELMSVHPANRDSANYEEECSPASRREYHAMCAKVEAITRALAWGGLDQ